MITISGAVEMRLVGVGIALVKKGPLVSPPTVSRRVCIVPNVSASIFGVGRIWTVPSAKALVMTGMVVQVMRLLMAFVFCEGLAAGFFELMRTDLRQYDMALRIWPCQAEAELLLDVIRAFLGHARQHPLRRPTAVAPSVTDTISSCSFLRT